MTEHTHGGLDEPNVLDVVPAAPGLTCSHYRPGPDGMRACDNDAAYVVVYEATEGDDQPRNMPSCRECFTVPDDLRARANGFTDSGYLPNATRTAVVGVKIPGGTHKDGKFHSPMFHCLERGERADDTLPITTTAKVTPNALAMTRRDVCRECMQADDPRVLTQLWATVRQVRKAKLHPDDPRRDSPPGGA